MSRLTHNKRKRSIHSRKRNSRKRNSRKRNSRKRSIHSLKRNTQKRNTQRTYNIVNVNRIIKDPHNQEQNNVKKENNRQRYIQNRVREASLAANAQSEYSKKWEGHNFAAEGDYWYSNKI